MKKILVALSLLALWSCKDTPAGTIHKLDKANNDQIEVYRYYFDDNDWVYVSRFKDCPNVQTTTWTETQGKTTVSKSNVVVYENDSIQVILKNRE